MSRSSIADWFDDVARRSPAMVALRTPARDHTFDELRVAAGALAGELAARQLAGARIAILARDHAAIVTAILGILEARCVFAPLDATAHDERLAGLAARLGVAAIVVDDATRERAAIVAPGTPVIELGPRDPAAVRAAADLEAACSIYFTSGTTGAPRAIVGRLAGIAHHVAWEIDFLGLDRAVRGAILHAPSYDAYLADVLVPMCAGGTACAPAERDVVLDAARLCAWLAAERISLLHCVPSTFRALLACGEAAGLTDLRHVLLAGEVVRPADVRAARRVFGDQLRLINLYGPTEATFVKLHHEITAADAERESVPIGVPMPEVTVQVLDDELRAVAPGEIGQLAIQSRFGSLGYLDEPERTRARFLEAGNGEQRYLTGDYGRQLADGRFAFHGRRDRQIKLLGARLDLDDLEAALVECADVVEAVVVAEGEAVLHGFVVLAPTGSLAAVRAHAMRRLPPAARLAWLDRVDAMPRTPSGKLDRQRLLEEAAR